jgi:hypothetical protein
MVSNWQKYVCDIGSYGGEMHGPSEVEVEVEM